mmetsp:Transcript_36985/g.96923  ORF Transcript_36985/g.96923 Transcript_36985/m.96923 type:complete len:374 (+) Transcript_36985:155-1276(+)
MRVAAIMTALLIALAADGSAAPNGGHAEPEHTTHDSIALGADPTDPLAHEEARHQHDDPLPAGAEDHDDPHEEEHHELGTEHPAEHPDTTPNDGYYTPPDGEDHPGFDENGDPLEEVHFGVDPDQDPHRAGPHAPEFKKSKEGAGGGPEDELAPEWAEIGLTEKLRFFSNHGELEVLADGHYDGMSVHDFLVEDFGEQEEHGLMNEAGVTCSFHYLSEGLGEHAKEHDREYMEIMKQEDGNATMNEYWRMYLYDFGTHHECTVTTSARWGHSAMNFSYARLVVTDPHSAAMEVVSTHVWPQASAKFFDTGHSVSDEVIKDHDLKLGSRLRTTGGHPDVPFPEGHGMVSKEGWTGQISQLALHFKPAPRDMRDL